MYLTGGVDKNAKHNQCVTVAKVDEFTKASSQELRSSIWDKCLVDDKQAIMIINVIYLNIDFKNSFIPFLKTLIMF